MGALTVASGGIATELAGDNKLLLRRVTLASNSDTLTLVRATDKITTIQKVFAQIVNGGASGFGFVNVSFSGLVITIASFNAAGASATTFGDVDLLIIGY